jgi:protein O-mannosyl-transferase
MWLVAAVLALVTIALYWPATGYDFINFDDPDYVAANPHVQAGLTWEGIGWAFASLDIGLWHPLAWISHMLDCQWFGLHPGRHHLTSVLWHAANTVLLLVVLRGMTGALWRSAVVAALFALHPLHVESVAWVAERKDVLSTFFVLLMLWAYHRYTEGGQQKSEDRNPRTEGRPKSEDRRPEPEATSPRSTVRGPSAVFHLPSSMFYLLSLCFFALGLMSKPMIVTLPLLLLLLDYWPLGRMQYAKARDTEHATPVFRSPSSVAELRRVDSTAEGGRNTQHVSPSTVFRLVLEKLPFLVLSGLTGLITLHAATGVGSLPSAAQYPMADRLANAILSYARYLWEVFWPGNLAIFYPFPAAFSPSAVAGAALLLAGISVAALCLARRRPYLVVGWLWYLVTLLPVIGLIQLAGYSHADRYTYVPLIGVFIALTWGAAEVISHWRRLALAGVGAAVAAMTLLCLVRARQQVGYWKESETLFRHALAVTKDNWLAHINLGETLDAKGQIDEAIRHYEEAVRLKPDHPSAHINLGAALNDKGDTDEAIRQYQEALRLKPDHDQAHNNLGIALGRKGQTGEAIRQFQEAIRLKPDYAEAHSNLGTAFYQQGRTGEAIREYQEALRLKPDYADARRNLDAVLATKAGSSLAPGTSTNR